MAQRDGETTMRDAGQVRAESYGQHGLTIVDQFGVLLSKHSIVRVVRRYHRPKVLDIGCGYDATLLRNLVSLIGPSVGVDVHVSDEVQAMPGLRFIEQPVEKALDALAADRFDIITLISVLEHLWDPLLVLTACHALLRPGGSLLINVPNWRGKVLLEFSAFTLGWSPPVEMNDHKMYYDKRDLWPLLVRAGFRPSDLSLRYHKFGLNLFAVATKTMTDPWDA